jgi:hypothetical protein
MLPRYPPMRNMGLCPSEPLSAMLTRVILRPALLSTTERLRVWCAALVGCALLVVCALMLGGCFARRQAVEQRSTQGPTSEQMLNLRVMLESGRQPTFEEKRQWEGQIDEKISAYLREHPDKANALDVSTFRYLRQVTVGMDKEQVLILLGAPASVSGDQAQMEKIARRYWTTIKGNATEVWVYPLGWNMFFAGQRLIDITQYVPPS